MVVQIPAKNVFCGGRRRHRLISELHTGLFSRSATFAVITVWAGGHQVLPAVPTSQPAWNHVIDRQSSLRFPAVLAAVVISPENFLLAEFYDGARTFYHPGQSDY
jgi:hypothetical protein